MECVESVGCEFPFFFPSVSVFFSVGLSLEKITGGNSSPYQLTNGDLKDEEILFYKSHRPGMRLAGKHAFQPLTHILAVDEVPESIEVVDASALDILGIKSMLSRRAA